MKLSKTFLWAMLLSLVVLSTASCSSDGDEKQIRELLERTVELAEAGRSGDLRDLLTSDFTVSPSPRGGMKLGATIHFGLQRLRKGRLYHPRPAVDVDGEQAQASFPFLVVRGQEAQKMDRDQDAQEWLGELADKTRLMKIHLQLRKTDDGWRISGAVLERFTGTGFRRIR